MAYIYHSFGVMLEAIVENSDSRFAASFLRQKVDAHGRDGDDGRGRDAHRCGHRRTSRRTGR